MILNKKKRALEIVRKAGILRPKDLDRYGIPREYLRRLLAEGRVVRLSRGLYASPNLNLSEHHSLAEASKRVPHGVICLLSALRYHELTTQIPHEVWMALAASGRLPQGHGLPIRFVRFSGVSLTEGVARCKIEGVRVRITVPAKTVADCFKFRNKIGLDVALEALRDCWNKGLATMDELWHFAGVCRVARVMRPYLESLI